MFATPSFRALKIKRTRYFVPADVMQDAAERAKARAFVIAARAAGVSTLLHISTTDLRSKRGPVVSTTAYQRNVGRIVVYFRALGVRTSAPGTRSTTRRRRRGTTSATRSRTSRACTGGASAAARPARVVGLDVLDQAGVDRYMASFYRAPAARPGASG